MKHYLVCPPSDPDRYAACVLAVGPSAPLDELDTIIEDLRRLGVAGQVLFDLFVANASRVRRYFSINFDGTDFEPFDFEKVSGDYELRRHSAALLAEHLPVLDMVMMSPAQRFAVSTGMVI